MYGTQNKILSEHSGYIPEPEGGENFEELDRMADTSRERDKQVELRTQTYRLYWKDILYIKTTTSSSSSSPTTGRMTMNEEANNRDDSIGSGNID